MAGISHKSFNHMLSEFVSNLSETFDDVKELQTAKTALTSMLEVNDEVEIPLITFHEIFSPHSDLIMKKDPSILEHVGIPLADGFDMKVAYDESDDETKEAIWGYIQQLLFISTTVKTMTPEMFETIGSVTEAYMQKVRDGTISTEDATNPFMIAQEIKNNPDIMKHLEE